jgi:signal transduction histidine kinase
MAVMRRLTPVEHPADRPRSRWVFDVLVFVVALGSGFPSLFEDGGHPPAIAYPAVFVVLLPVVMRRIYPVPVFVWLLAMSVASSVLFDTVVAGFSLLIALFTIAAIRSRQTALTAVAFLEVLAVTQAIKEGGGGDGPGPWGASLLATGLVGAALGLGLYLGTRRAYLAELRERAIRMEHERDQQGALAAAAERGRISREMHDIVAHHLSVMIALSDGAIAATATSPEKGIEVMRTVSATGRRALADTRRLLGVLRETNDDQTLAPQPDLAEVDALIAQVRAAGLATSFEVHGSVPDVPTGIQLTVYRLVQEALTNTLKHGGKEARASVKLRYSPGELQVIVDDDGAGTSAPVAVGMGSGLRGMQERVNAYGGAVQSGPREPGGWRVTARLPLDDPSSRDAGAS